MKSQRFNDHNEFNASLTILDFVFVLVVVHVVGLSPYLTVHCALSNHSQWQGSAFGQFLSY